MSEQRKFIQISAAASDYRAIVYALDESGGVWMLASEWSDDVPSKQRDVWKQITDERISRSLSSEG